MIIVATVDSKTGKVLAGPDLVSRGFVYVREKDVYKRQARICGKSSFAQRLR